MKKLLIFALISSFSLSIHAQVKFGARGGFSTSDINPEKLLIFNKDDVKEFELAINDAKYGVHFGFFTQFRLKSFFIQPELLFNSNKVDFKVSHLENGNWVDMIKSEKYQNLDIPVMMGWKLGPLRLQGGPVGHVFINSSSELTDFENYKEKFDQMTFGWQAGFGLDIWNIVLDAKWEGNFNKFGDHITFFDTQYNFDDTPGRFLVSLGIAF